MNVSEDLAEVEVWRGALGGDSEGEKQVLSHK